MILLPRLKCRTSPCMSSCSFLAFFFTFPDLTLFDGLFVSRVSPVVWRLIQWIRVFSFRLLPCVVSPPCHYFFSFQLFAIVIARFCMLSSPTTRWPERALRWVWPNVCLSLFHFVLYFDGIKLPFHSAVVFRSRPADTEHVFPRRSRLN